MDFERIYKIKNKILYSNTYICPTHNGRECILIDPGSDYESIDNKIMELGLKPIGIFCTHGHFDHIASVKKFQKKYNCKFYLHELDLKIAQSSNFLLRIFKIKLFIDIPIPDIFIKKDKTFAIGKNIINVFHTPGHTPGSCTIQFNNSIFPGDLVYFNSIELVNLPGEDKNLLKESIIKIWDLFPYTHFLYPGHGRSGLFGDMKRNNIKIRNFLKQEKI